MVIFREALRRLKLYIQWGVVWFTMGIAYDIALTTLLSCSLQHDTFTLGWVDQTPLASVCRNVYSIPSTHVSASHVTQRKNINVNTR
jgi:hypothetical protein